MYLNTKEQLLILSFISALSSGGLGSYIYLSCRLGWTVKHHYIYLGEGRETNVTETTHCENSKKTKCLFYLFLYTLKLAFKELIIGQIIKSYAAGQTRMLQYLCMYIKIHMYTFIYTHTRAHEKEAPIFSLVLNIELLLSPGY